MLFNSLCLCLVLCVGVGAQTVTYQAGAYTSSCTQVCEAANLYCADAMVEKMNCASLASTYCSSSTLSSNSNIGCTVSGCYVNCVQAYYYGKTSSYSSCNTGGTCLTTSSNLYKLCPCYEQATSELEGWAKVGLYLAGAIVLVVAGLAVRAMMNKSSNEHEALDTSASDYDIESSGQRGLLASLADVFSRKSEESSSKKKKVKKVKKARFKTKMPLDEEMDETRDMAIK
mmetsp:Transcript_22678/g.38362  ORF Transcript_22678/g.38362 Transcript_22678/m.38362 type:complete len:229 (-) Transcript_22678:351-1037(-)